VSLTEGGDGAREAAPARRARKPKLRVVDANESDGRPRIVVGTDLHRVVDEASYALTFDPDMYQRGGRLARVVRVVETDRYMVEGTPKIVDVPAATLTERLSRFAQFVAVTDDGAVACLPPQSTVLALAARGQWEDVRPIRAVSETPILRADLSACTDVGYDPETACIYAPSCEFPPVPDAPTQGDAMRALAALCEPFKDFPYAREADRYVPVAAILTILARDAIRGSVPAFVFDASTRGSGKSLQTDVISIIATGRHAARKSFPADDVELEKVLGAYAMAGSRVITFDNVTGRFGGGPLDAVITSVESVELRILGRSEVAHVAWGATILASGNNVEVHSDTVRRVLVCRIEPAVERPEDRVDFVHPDLRAWVLAERPRLVVAALTVLRAWHCAGRPAGKRLGSFEAWSDLVPGAIVHAGGADPMLTRIADDRDDAELAALRMLLTGLREHYPAGVATRKLADDLYGRREPGYPDGKDSLREAIESMCHGASALRPPTSPKIASAMRRSKGRVVAGMRLDIDGTEHGGAARWIASSCG